MVVKISEAPRFIAFTSAQSGAAMLVLVFAFLSTIAILSVAARVLWLGIRQKMDPVHARPQEYIFFNTQLGHYATCLLIANLCDGVAGVLDVRWISEKGITPDNFCTFQGILMQLGSWGTAYFTVTIAVHTFNSLVLKRRQSVLVSVITIALGWISAALLAAGPFVDPDQYPIGPAYGPDGLSCGIRSVYLKAQFFFHLFPIFVASVLSAILYSLIFLVLRGTLNINGGIKLTFDPNERYGSTGVTENYHKFVARIARSMVWYPVAYIALLVPYSVTRLLSISGFQVSFAGLIFAYVCWFLLGIVNVLLLYNTFRVLGPAFNTSQKETAMHFATNPSMEKDQKFGQFQFPQPTPVHSPQLSFSNGSARCLLPQESAGTASFYSYPASESLGRSITPFNELERAMSPLTSQKLAPIGTPTALEQKLLISTEPAGLPLPPRRNRSPIVQFPSDDSIKQPEPSLQPRRSVGSPRLKNHLSTATFGQPTTPCESIISFYESDEWSSRANEGMLSPPTSGKTGFASSSLVNALPNPHPRPLPSLPRHSRSFSAISSSTPSLASRQRTLLSPGGTNGQRNLRHARSSESSRGNYI